MMVKPVITLFNYASWQGDNLPCNTFATLLQRFSIFGQFLKGWLLRVTNKFFFIKPHVTGEYASFKIVDYVAIPSLDLEYLTQNGVKTIICLSTFYKHFIFRNSSNTLMRSGGTLSPQPHLHNQTLAITGLVNNSIWIISPRSGTNSEKRKILPFVFSCK